MRCWPYFPASEPDEARFVDLLAGRAVGAPLVKEQAVRVETSRGDAHPEEVVTGVRKPKDGRAAASAFGVKERWVETGRAVSHCTPPEHLQGGLLFH